MLSVTSNINTRRSVSGNHCVCVSDFLHLYVLQVWLRIFCLYFLFFVLVGKGGGWWSRNKNIFYYCFLITLFFVFVLLWSVVA